MHNIVQISQHTDSTKIAQYTDWEQIAQDT